MHAQQTSRLNPHQRGPERGARRERRQKKKRDHPCVDRYLSATHTTEDTGVRPSDHPQQTTNSTARRRVVVYADTPPPKKQASSSLPLAVADKTNKKSLVPIYIYIRGVTADSTFVKTRCPPEDGPRKTLFILGSAR